MKLQQAFGIQRGEVVSFIGAGGKTSALVGLGYELMEAGWRVLATTTTTLDEEQLLFMPHTLHRDVGREAISAALSEYGFVFLYDHILNGQVYGVPLGYLHQLLDQVDSDVLLIEADRANGLPLKAPYADEPVIPDVTSLVISVASLKALDQPLDDSHIYNAQAMIDKFGFYPGSSVRSPWIAQVLRDESLGLRGIPDKVRVMAFINQTPPSGYLRGRARRIAKLILKTPRIDGVALGSVRGANPVSEVQRPVGAVVLASDPSLDNGQAASLMRWNQGKTIIEHVIEQLVRARIDPIVVVTGDKAANVKRCIKPFDITVVHDKAHKLGNPLTALQAGLEAMPSQIASSLLVMGNQPRLQASVLYQLLAAYAEGSGNWILPRHNGQYGFPMLIGREHWSAFLEAEHPQTIVALRMAKPHQHTSVHVNTDSIMNHIESLDDYHRERRLAGLRALRMPENKSDAS